MCSAHNYSPTLHASARRGDPGDDGDQRSSDTRMPRVYGVGNPSWDRARWTTERDCVVVPIDTDAGHGCWNCDGTLTPSVGEGNAGWLHRKISDAGIFPCSTISGQLALPRRRIVVDDGAVRTFRNVYAT